MKYSKEYIQNCNLILITFMIVFGIIGLVATQKSNSEKELQQLDKQLDQYEIDLQTYQSELEMMEHDEVYMEKYAEYEAKYDEYMKVYTQRQELYKTYEKEATEGIHFNGSILYIGIGILMVVMIGLNIYFKKAK